MMGGVPEETGRPLFRRVRRSSTVKAKKEEWVVFPSAYGSIFTLVLANIFPFWPESSTQKELP